MNGQLNYEQEVRQLNGILMDSMFYSESFQRVIEDHLDLLRLNNAGVIDVEPNDAYRFEHDYYNLLRFKNVPYRLHWVVMRMNGFISPFDATPDIREIIMPNNNLIEQLLNMHITTQQQVN